MIIVLGYTINKSEWVHLFLFMVRNKIYRGCGGYHPLTDSRVTTVGHNPMIIVLGYTINKSEWVHLFLFMVRNKIYRGCQGLPWLPWVGVTLVTLG